MGKGRSAERLSLIRGGSPVIRCAVIALLFTPVVAAAQTTDDYWRALQAASAPSIVLASQAPPAVPEPIAEGLRLFRAWELAQDAGAARRARELLRRADVAPEHRDWHALALAMVYARGPDSRIDVGDGHRITDPHSLASAHSLRLLRAALAGRPQFREAALELARWALDRADRRVAAEAEIALAGQEQDAEVLAMRSELNLVLDQPARAAELAAGAQRIGADASVVRHRRAWALFQYEASVEDAIRLYYLGADDLTDAGRAEYSRALEPLLSDEEREEWRATSNERAGEWLRRYWARNAARAGVLPDERLAEHYRRAHRARVDFPNTSPLSVLHQQARFGLGEDSRHFGLSLHGLMLVRHGDPYRLAAIEECLSNPWTKPGVTGTICAELGPERLAVFQRMTRVAGGDSYFPFVRPLDLVFGAYAFRGEGDTNQLLFAVGLPAGSALALVAPNGRLDGTLTAVVLRDSGDFVRRDSPIDIDAPGYLDPRAAPSDSVTLVFGTLDVPAEDATRPYRVTVSDARRHAGGIGSGTLRIHDFSALSVSDLVVAPATMPVGWRRGAVDVAFAPLAVYEPGETVAVYYEVYGLVDGAQYETEIELAPPADNVGERLLDLVRDRSVRFRFTGTASDPHPIFGVQESRTLGLRGLDTGIWTMRVRVTDRASGRTTLREASMEIQE